MSAPAIVVLHGANGCAAELEPFAAPLREYGRVLVPNLPGHGGRPLPERLSIAGNAADVIELLDREGIDRAVFVGYSLGGYTSLYLARHHPARTLGACAMATKFVFDAATMAHWVHLAQPARLERPGNPRAGELQRSHGDGWRALTLANAAHFQDLGRKAPLSDGDLGAIARPVLLVNSNRDSLVSWAETLRAGGLIPGAKLVMFYGMAHPLRVIPMSPVTRAIGEWITRAASE